ncbi:cytochrome c oxidase subunit 3 [Rhizobium sp. A37_96]
MSQAALQDAGDDPADELLLWILVWSELVAFGVLFGAFLVTALLQQSVFAAARLHLNPELAALNTIILLTSGWQAALAARTGASHRQSRRALLFAALLGLAFALVKVAEYAGELPFAGDPSFGSFFELYLLTTGFHLLHVLFGAFVLLLVAWRPSRSNITLITTLWHVIDLVWVVMFPLVYLA